MQRFWKRIKQLPKRKQALLGILCVVLIIGISTLLWAIFSGKIKPFAFLLTQIENTATVTYTDPSGSVKTATSNKLIIPLNPTVNGAIALNPATGSYNVNSSFNVAIVVNSGSQEIKEAKAVITYDKTKLSVNDADGNSANGVQISGATTILPKEVANTVDTTNGKITYTRTINTGDASGYRGTATLATISFKAIAQVTSTPVTISTGSGNSQLIAANNSNVLSTVTNGNYTVNPVTTTVNLHITLQGRTNYATSGTKLTIYPAGSTTSVYTKTDISTDGQGNATFTMNSLASGNYDFKLEVTSYLGKKILNTAAASPQTLNFTDVRAGDLSGDGAVNSIDFSTLNSKWTTNDPVADINKDSVVNSIDYGLLNSNWGSHL